jgi:hypothetical protein
MCASTRFREAIPLRNIKAKTIIKALTIYFLLCGSSYNNSVKSGIQFYFSFISASYA